MPSSFPSCFRCLFGSILVPFSLPTCFQNPPKIHQKSMPRGTPSWASNFDRCLMDLGSQLRPPEPQKSLTVHWFYKSFAFFSHFKIRTIFDSILAPTWLHFPSKNPTKILQNRIFKGILKINDFGVVFGASLAPTWGHLGAQVGAMLGSKTALEPPKMPPKTPNLEPKQPSRPPT